MVNVVNDFRGRIINKIVGGAVLLCVVATCSVKSRKYKLPEDIFLK